MSEYLGLLGFLQEANDIKAERGVSFAEAMELQREAAAERLAQLEAAETNVLQFRPRAH